MPIIKSARKRVRVAEKATIRNAKTKRQLKRSLKSFTAKASHESLKELQSSIDKATKKNVIHKNKANRLKKRAAKMAKEKNIKPVKAVAKKAAPANKPKTVKETTSSTTKKK